MPGVNNGVPRIPPTTCYVPRIPEFQTGNKVVEARTDLCNISGGPKRSFLWTSTARHQPMTGSFDSRLDFLMAHGPRKTRVDDQKRNHGELGLRSHPLVSG